MTRVFLTSRCGAVRGIILYCGRVPASNALGMHCSRRLIVQTLVFSHSYLHRQVFPPETLVVKGGTTWILPENARLPRNIQGSFTCRKSTTWDKRLYFPSEGRRAEHFFALKNPTASAGFESANFATKGQYTTSSPPKPQVNIIFKKFMFYMILFQYCTKRYTFPVQGPSKTQI